MNKYFIYTDGGARGNPGQGAIGAVIKAENNRILQSIYQRIGKTTNNIAEYSAVVKALEWLRDNASMMQCNNETIYQFFLDSTLIVNQLNGLYKVKENHLRELLLKVRGLEQEVSGQIYYSLIPREKNYEADALVNKALGEL